jgi:type II secretory pathway predicted ATPase ExeA
MYEQFFRLQRRPFAATPDPACFVSSDSTAEILSQLTVCIEHGQGIGILTAPAGMGKTLLCQRLVQDLGERFRSLFLGNSNFPTRRSLLQAILFELGIEPSRKDEQELRHELRSALGEIRHDYEALVLVVDEAHLFEASVLEEIRTLVDFADEGHSLVRVILSGQLELEERMTDRQFDAINQRTSAHVCVEPLSIAESVGYVRQRIEWAGGNPDEVISEEGVLIIARASCGVPRCLNQLADHSLLLGFAADESPVSESTVREALEDLKQLPLHWNDVNDADRMIASCSESVSTDDADSTGDADSTDEVGEVTAEDEPTLQEATSSESQVELESEEVAAPFAVFEFGADDSPREDEEGETLDEVPAELPASSSDWPESADEKIHESAEHEVAQAAEAATRDEFELGGQPSPPVSEICGVVLDLSAEVCGVSEYVGNTPVEAQSAVEPGLASDSASDLEPEQPEEKTAESESAEDSASPTAVFEFGPSDEAEAESAEEHSDETTLAEDEPADESSDETDPTAEAAPTEVQVLAEVDSVEREIADVTAEFDLDSEPTAEADPAVDETTQPENDAQVEDQSSDEAAPTEEEVLAEIASVEREIAEVTAEFDLDSEPAGDADSVVVLDDESAAEEAFEPNSSSSKLDEGAGLANDATEAVTARAVEFEVVSDPYSAIQEPLSAGIVWDVPPAQETPVALDSASDLEDEATPEESCDFEETLDEETVAETSAEDDPEASQIESEDAIFEESGEVVSDEFAESIMRDWVEDSSDFQDEQLDVVEAPDAELSLFAAEADDPSKEDSPQDCVEQDDVEPVPVREIHPDRFIDAIVPMLDEIEDRFTSRSDRADVPERAAGDIEAELVEAISADDADIEDEIGSAVLDLCLDTQWSLQQDRVESPEESDEPSSQSRFEPEPERYDVVEPEEPSSASFVEQVSELSQAEPDELTSTSVGEARRPFGRLFSDLRRRST